MLQGGHCIENIRFEKGPYIWILFANKSSEIDTTQSHGFCVFVCFSICIGNIGRQINKWIDKNKISKVSLQIYLFFIHNYQIIIF